MNSSELKKLIRCGGLEKYGELYSEPMLDAERLISAIERFEELFGKDRDISILSVPGRSEIIGNHTDHNNGEVMAGAIDRDIIAVVSKNGENKIRLQSEGYRLDTIDLAAELSPDRVRKFTSHALIAGVAEGFLGKGYNIGGFDAYTTTKVLKGSGLSSSAAFEVMIGNILSHLYNDGGVDAKELARLGQYAENVYFGKPSGLMDQMACAVGGFVYIDFEDNFAPVVEPIGFSLKEHGYSLCIINTGGSHASLNDDYASVPLEMREVAGYFGKKVLRGITEDEIVSEAKGIRERYGDRAILRALHFVRENARVGAARDCLKSGNVDAFLDTVKASGHSSFMYLQNVYTNKKPDEQGLSLALALADGYLKGRSGAYRVHGGGFAGTVQVFVRDEDAEGLVRLMDGVFGEGAAMKLSIRSVGACKLF
jgi:galactokinase